MQSDYHSKSRNAYSEGSVSGRATTQKEEMQIQEVVYPVELRFKKQKCKSRW